MWEFLLVLALLGTRPLYEGQGAGSMLLAYGLRKADEEQLDAFLEASPPGEPLYLKHGFEVQERVSVMVPVDGQLKPYKNALMVRKPKPLDASSCSLSLASSSLTASPASQATAAPQPYRLSGNWVSEQPLPRPSSPHSAQPAAAPLSSG